MVIADGASLEIDPFALHRGRYGSTLQSSDGMRLLVASTVQIIDSFNPVPYPYPIPGPEHFRARYGESMLAGYSWWDSQAM